MAARTSTFFTVAALTLATGLVSSEARASETDYDEACAAAAEEPVESMSEKTCFPVFGWFDAEVIPPPACTSPVGFCTEGNLYGVLRGGYSLTGEQFLQTGDGRIPFVNFFTGTSDVSSTLGNFIGVDAGSINLSAPGSIGSGRVSTLITITENTGGGWLPIDSGFLYIRGRSDLATGTVDGDYAGIVCFDD